MSSERLHFLPVHTTNEMSFSEIDAGERFQKASLLVTEDAVYRWMRTQKGQKRHLFKNIRIRGDAALIDGLNRAFTVMLESLFCLDSKLLDEKNSTSI